MTTEPGADPDGSGPPGDVMDVRPPTPARGPRRALDVAPEIDPGPAPRPSAVVGIVVVALTTLVVGVLTGVLWARVTVLPTYRRNPDGGGSTDERGLTRFISGDVTFTVIGLVVGIGLGIVTWRWLGRRLGWRSVVVATLAAVLAGVLCWQVGQLVGPSDFSAWMAAAAPGDLIPIDLRLRAVSALAAWVFGAAATLLAITTFVADDEEPRLLRLPWTRPAPPED